MVVKVFKDAEAIGKAAASMFAAKVLEKPDCVLGLATGSTPIPTYKAMADLYNAGAVDYSKVTTFNLDEYVGLNHEHDQSYYYFMHDNLFNYINVPEESIHVLSGTAADLEKECADYEKAIETPAVLIFRFSVSVITVTSLSTSPLMLSLRKRMSFL